MESREGSQEKKILLSVLTQKLLLAISEVRAIGYTDLSTRSRLLFRIKINIVTQE